MKYYEIPHTNMRQSAVIQGCMRFKGMSSTEVEQIVNLCLENGINSFDHADVYGTAGMRGECEQLFGQVLKENPGLRDKVYIQSKCGICKSEQDYYDFSKEHILEAVDGILTRLQTEYLDALLLHRPDTLMEPEEVADAFETLHKAGKVRYFGVSNMNPGQVELLDRAVDAPLVFNQLQLSIAHCPMIDTGLSVNNRIPQAVDYEGGILEYSRLKAMTIQAWSPFQKGLFEGPFLTDWETYGELNAYIDQLAEKYNVTNTAIAVAWILRHPAHMQVILGTTNQKRIADACQGADITLTREEWYTLYAKAGKRIL
ncbi:aldo/keto reductase [Lachnospiraceae bacterium HCP28S3_F9]|uniref:aldo/keto reductase n=1 Tax=Lachnospiraceae TaxID=186803 RepID=UPI002A76A1EA|nr:aldo/keto reductase [Lachnospiraceae bacterium]MCI6533426.1 aldo/keto reductase [Lachnospiraceae bacterium]MDY2613713.1 aldo/keto reductase [Lachnospiraceae bacterium]